VHDRAGSPRGSGGPSTPPGPDRAIPWILDERGPGTDVMTGASGFVGVHLTRRPLEDGGARPAPPDKVADVITPQSLAV